MILNISATRLRFQPWEGIGCKYKILSFDVIYGLIMASWIAETCSKIWIYFNQSKVLTWPRYLVFRHCENTTGPYPQPARITFVFRLDPSFVFYMFTAPKAFLILANRDITILSHLAQFDLHNNIWWTVVHYGTQEDKIVSSLPYVQLVFSIMCFRKL